MAKSSRPNFLLFITDQHRADFLGCYGHPVLRTPHIDSIARRGTAFRPLLRREPGLPAEPRQLMTGRMPSVHDVRQQRHPAVDGGGDLVDLLRDAGYRTALVGKSHLQNFTAHDPIIKRRPPRPGFHEPSPICASRSAITSTIRL